MHSSLLARWTAIVLAACISAAAWVARAEIPEALQNKPVNEVRVAGEVAEIAAAREAGIPLGAPLTRKLVRTAIERLLASGRWIDVQVDAEPQDDGVLLTLHLEPRITLRRIDIQGTHHVDEEVITDALGVSRGSELSSEGLEALSAATRKAYAERGYLGARVDVSFRDTDDPSSKVLMVNIEEGAPTRITEIVFAGQQPTDPLGVREAMGVALDDVLDRRVLAESAKKGELYLRAQRYFEASLDAPILTIEGEQAKVTFPAHVGPRYSYDVLGTSPLPVEEVIEALQLDRERLTDQTLDLMPARVKNAYARHGFIEARVSIARLQSRLGARSADRAVLRIRVVPGRQLEVVDIGFTGAQHFPREQLQDQIVSYLEDDLPNSDLIQIVDSDVADDLTTGKTTPERQVPKPMAENPAGTYYEPTYTEAIKHITELYQADGFLSVKVGPAVLERVGESRATVNIPVVEGPQTLLHDVVLQGQRLVSERELLVASGLTRNQPFSYLRLEEARLRMQNLYNERGHMFVKIEPSVRFSRDRTRAEVTFQISERFPVHVGEIVVRGTERTSVAFIRNLLALQPGDLYQPSKARKSEETLQALGVFTGVSIGMQDPDLPARVKPLLVTVSERRNQFLDFSAGVSTGQGVRGGFEYGYRNLFDRAVSMTLRVQFAHQLFFVSPELRRRFEALALQDRLERNISLGTVIPRVPGLGSTRTAIDLVHVRHNERDFGLDKNGGTLTFTETPWHRITLTEAADLENNNVDLFVSEALNDYLAMTSDPRLKRLLRVPEGNTTLAAARLGISYDQRDSPFTPTKGYFVSASSELATTLATETVSADKAQFLSRFLKLQITGSGYVPLGRSVVLAGQARVGRIVHLQHDSKTYPDRAFFLGGVDTMRGYYLDEMVPQDIANKIITDPKLTPNSIVRSGDAFILLKGELRFPVYGQLGAGLFTDIGNLWADPAMMNPFQLRPIAGAGLRLATPVGPIAVDYGIVLTRRRALGEPFGTLQFSIGLF